MPSLHQAVLFGGANASNAPLNDTWVMQSTCWTRAHPAQSPPANTILASAYDANMGQVVVLLYGAPGGQAYLDLTTWLWNGQNWLEASGAGPRVSAGQAAYDQNSKRVILFAIADAGGAAQTWSWNGSSWSLLSPTISPAARFNAAMVADPATNKVLLFGGASGGAGTVLADTWTWNGNQWAQLAPQPGPPARQQSTIAGFASQRRSILVGGLGSAGSVLNDAWQWDGINWVAIPSFGANCCSVAVDDGNEVVIFGGGSDRATNQVRSWNGTAWAAA